MPSVHTMRFLGITSTLSVSHSRTVTRILQRLPVVSVQRGTVPAERPIPPAWPPRSERRSTRGSPRSGRPIEADRSQTVRRREVPQCGQVSGCLALILISQNNEVRALAKLVGAVDVHAGYDLARGCRTVPRVLARWVVPADEGTDRAVQGET